MRALLLLVLAGCTRFGGSLAVGSEKLTPVACAASGPPQTHSPDGEAIRGVVAFHSCGR